MFLRELPCKYGGTGEVKASSQNLLKCDTINIMHNSAFFLPMDLFEELQFDPTEVLLNETTGNLNGCSYNGYEDLQDKYFSLHEVYAKEVENSKKVEKCLMKCLKFYSKLCKKHEAQQKVVATLEESLKEKENALEEYIRNEEKMNGVLEMYKAERTLYSKVSCESLQKDKEILLDICCRLIKDSAAAFSIRNATSLLLKKFKKDLSEDKVAMLKEKAASCKKEPPIKFKSNLSLQTSDFPGINFEDDFSGSEVDNVDKDRTTEIGIQSINSQTNSQNTVCGREEENSLEVGEHQEGADVREEPLPCSLPVIQFGQSCHLGNLESNNQEVSNCDDLGIERDKVEKCASEHSNQPKNNVGLISDYSSDDSDCASIAQNNTKSIFDVCSMNTTKTQSSGGSLFDIPNDSPVGCSNTPNVNLDEDLVVNFETIEETETELNEKDLYRVFSEMTNVRLLSPIKDLEKYTKTEFSVDIHKSVGTVRINKVRKKRLSSESSEGSDRSKKTKKISEDKTQKHPGLLDSIMSAMSVQNKEFKSFASQKASPVKEEFPTSKISERCDTPENFAPTHHDAQKLSCSVQVDNGCKKTSSGLRLSPRIKKEKEVGLEKTVLNEIKNFASCSITSKEEADKKVKHCVSVLVKIPEETIARCIVTIVLENVDEDVEIFERPAPPLTKTQHRLMVILSVLKTLDYNYVELCSKIMTMILDKLFPDKFFWPDDCVETVTRFYAALCKSHNDFNTIWKFCLRAMTDMKQRSCLIMFTVLKTWPDVLHDATTLRNNILAVTIVNIFLHTPKGEGLQNLNQKKKLLALKHLLMNFYQFKVEDTMETYAIKVFEAFLKGEKGSKKSIMLLAKCRKWTWTKTNILGKLKGVMEKWFEGKVEDSTGYRVLSAVKEFCLMFARESDVNATELGGLIPCLSAVLNSGKASHSLEQSIIEILLQMKQHAEARKIIREWVPKGVISDSLRNEIINASAENILRELKLNKRKDRSEKKNMNRFKNDFKGKGKKKKKKKKGRTKQSVKKMENCDG